MSKYTIEVFLKDLTGFESTTILFDLSYLELLETYALISALKFHEAKVMLQTKEINTRSISFEEFVLSNSTEKMICELKNS